MKSRYFVATEIASGIVSELRIFYRNNFLSKMPIKNIHLTLMAPFFVKGNKNEKEIVKRIEEIKVNQFMAKFVSLDFFKQKGKKILYAKVEPEDQFLNLSKKIKTVLNDLVEMDIEPYSSASVPSFKAHVTLDYNFTKILPKSFLKLSFLVEKIVVFKEENREWIKL